MNIKETTDYATLAGALIAAVAAVWNLILQVRGKRDRFIVRLGSMSPTIEPEMMLTVVSCCDHPVRLTDWGFIEADATFTSIVMLWETGELEDDETRSSGSYHLESYGQHFEVGCIREKSPLGVFGMSATQRTPVISFNATAPMWLRLFIRVRILVQPTYLAW